MFFSALVAIVGSSTAQTCNTNTILASPPSDGNVALQAYSYCGGTLNVTAYIANLDYNKLVTLFFTNRQNVSTPLASISLNYIEGVASNFELWGSAVPIYIDGITELLNLTYQATDIGETFVQQIDIPVVASGASEPSPAAPPTPYATPLGLSSDITAWLQTNTTSEAVVAKSRMFSNINTNVTGATNGNSRNDFIMSLVC
jgi:glucoamylase